VESQEFLRVYSLLRPVHTPRNPADDKNAAFAATFSDIHRKERIEIAFERPSTNYPLKMQSLQKSKNFHAKTQSRKGTAKKSFAGSLRLRGFACALIFFLVPARPS